MTTRVKSTLDLEYVRECFSFCKATDDLIQATVKSIRVVDKDVVVGYLTAVGQFQCRNKELHKLMTVWRERHQYAYPSRFVVTEEGTARWLEAAVIENPNRLLFLVSDFLGNPVGHLGLLINDHDELEIDNVLRGAQISPGLMSNAMKSLEGWARSELRARHLVLRVLGSNGRARTFYERLNYESREVIPLGERVNNGTTLLLPEIEPVVDHFVVMEKDLDLDAPDRTRVLTAGPSIGLRESSYVLDAVQFGWNDRHSDYLKRFEESFAEFVGVDYAMATSSCTGALHLAMLALGIGPGDEVLVPEVTWVATASAVKYVGATPVFVDIDESTWTIDVDDAAKKISDRTRAIIPVHLYGYAADMPRITSLANAHSLHVIEDAAPAIGTTIGSQKVGSFGDFGCFSFQGAKMLVTGEGGMIVSSDIELIERARKIQDHGRKPGTFWIEEVGYKYKMSNVLAALGLAQLERCELQIEQKRQVFDWYHDSLSDLSTLSFQRELPGTRSICWMSSVELAADAPLTRDELRALLAESGIDTRPVFPPISTYNIWGLPQEAGVVATRIGNNSLNLPSGVGLSQATVCRVANEIRRAFERS